MSVWYRASLEAAEREAISAIGALGEAELTAVKAWVASGCEGPQPRPDPEARRVLTERLVQAIAAREATEKAAGGQNCGYPTDAASEVEIAATGSRCCTAYPHELAWSRRLTAWSTANSASTYRSFPSSSTCARMSPVGGKGTLRLRTLGRAGVSQQRSRPCENSEPISRFAQIRRSEHRVRRFPKF